MGTIKLTEKRVRLIGGRLYWCPTKAVKALGFSAEPLGDDPAKALTRARQLNADVDAARAGRPPVRHDVATLIGLYQQDTSYRKLRATTERQYRSVLDAIDQAAGKVLVATITRHQLKKTFEAVRVERGHATAINHMRIWRILLGFAYRDLGWLDRNPAEDLGLDHPPPRERTWTEAELEALFRVCIEQGRRSVMLACLLARDLGPRRYDICRLPWSAYRDGRFWVTETKRGKKVAVPATAQLIEALAATPKVGPIIVVSEGTGRPYTPTDLSHQVARLRRIAGIDQEGEVAPTFHDLRRSFLTELAEAGATPLEMAATTGQATETLKHYAHGSDGQAGAAISKLEAARSRRAKKDKS